MWVIPDDETHWAARLSAAMLILFCVSALNAAEPGQLEFADLLERNERLVRGVHGLVRMTLQPTAPDQIPKVKAAVEGWDDWNVFVVSEQQAATLSSWTEYWRKGPLERVNVLETDAREASVGDVRGFVKATAFDGSVVRDLQYHDSGIVIGSIDSIESSAWEKTNRHDPYSFQFEYQKTPYSDLVRRAPKFAQSRVERDGQEMKRVSFTHPDLEGLEFVLTLDSEDRLVERFYLSQWKSRGHERPMPQALHEFGDYELMPTGGGNHIWYPRSIVYHLYAGTTPEGEPAEWTTEIYEIHEFEINPEIPDEIFSLEFPPGTRIYDQLTGAGWLSGSGGVMDTINRQMTATLERIVSQPDLQSPPTFDASAQPPLANELEAAPAPDSESGAEGFPTLRVMGLVLGVFGVLLAVVLAIRIIRPGKRTS